MKYIYIIYSFLLICLFTGCSVDNAWNDKSLPGTWKLEAVNFSSGGEPRIWSAVEDGYTYSFRNDGTFSSTRFDECEQGTYITTANELKLDYGCEGFILGIEDTEGILVEELKFEGGYMILIPKYLQCIEGCKYKFRKIAPAE